MNQNQDWTKSRMRARSGDPDERIRAYIQKIATGLRMSKDLTQDEAEDGLLDIGTDALVGVPRARPRAVPD